MATGVTAATGAAAVVVFAGVVAPAPGAAFEPETGAGVDEAGLVAGAGVDDGTDVGFTAGAAAAGRTAAGAGVAGTAAGVRAAYETGPEGVALTGATLG